MDNKFNMSPNPVIRFLQKEPKDFTREDIINFCINNAVEFITFT